MSNVWAISKCMHASKYEWLLLSSLIVGWHAHWLQD